MPDPAALGAHDLVLFGATGFTGALTAEYLARHAPPGCRWALAGRDRSRLQAVRSRLVSIDPGLATLSIMPADVTDGGSLRALAGSARVLVSTVGPYLEYGQPVVAACAEAGTDYVDLTGEAEFVNSTYLRHHEQAVASGARIVHACGFESVVPDLGVRFTVLQLPEGVPLRVYGAVRSRGTLSGGTIAAALTAMSRPRQMRSAAAARRRREPRAVGRRIRSTARAPHRDEDTGLWLVPLPTIDPLVVRRSAAALEWYGPDFGYAHYAAVRRLPVVVGGLAGIGAAGLVAQVPFLRRQLLARVTGGGGAGDGPHSGPSQERRAAAWFSVRFVGEGDGKRVVTSVSGGDPGYGETSKMLAESALCLAFDDNPPTSGQVTTAVAMGANLTARLVRAGLSFEVQA